MSDTQDRLSRISALRAPRPAGRRAPQPGDGTELTSAVQGAEVKRNALGCHVAIRNRFSGPRPFPLSRRFMHLLLPGAGPEAANPANWLFLDTETTGLAGGTGTYAFLVGIAWWEGDGLVVEQFFMRDHSEEPSLLSALAERLHRTSVLVTFNGKCFDWPLLETRYRMTRLPAPHSPASHLDLLHPARTLWRFRLRSVALTELERSVLGVRREGDVPSSEIPGLYFQFLRGGPAGPLVPVFDHNRMDLVGLAVLAARMAEMVDDPARAGCDGTELFGISRLLHRRGDMTSAGSSYQRALEIGLPEEAERSARKELAWMARRRGDFEQANAHWEALAGDGRSGLIAYEQLAIHYEHRARDPLRAVEAVREAMRRLTEDHHAGRVARQAYYNWHGRLQHRLDRLIRKTGHP
ncbi:MAG: hypothetical protein FJW35_06655 [Acidobacteria bacterium]|nr:hypothetical protein [Acidobacteriota bacterium]